MCLISSKDTFSILIWKQSTLCFGTRAKQIIKAIWVKLSCLTVWATAACQRWGYGGASMQMMHTHRSRTVKSSPPGGLESPFWCSPGKLRRGDSGSRDVWGEKIAIGRRHPGPRLVFRKPSVGRKRVWMWVAHVRVGSSNDGIIASSLAKLFTVHR